MYVTKEAIEEVRRMLQPPLAPAFGTPPGGPPGGSALKRVAARRAVHDFSSTKFLSLNATDECAIVT
jgi:hypothetical protein